MNFSFKDFFAPSGAFPPAGIFSRFHFIMLALAAVIITVALLIFRHAKPKTVKIQIRFFALFLCTLEVIKIIFNLRTGHGSDPNSYMPLYFCSIAMYAGLLAGFAKGFWKRVGEVFLATGGIVGGLAYLIYPLTSLTIYPPIHFISFHSFAYHSVMVYLGLLLLITHYVQLKPEDVDKHVLLITGISLIAYFFNLIFHSNLMFVSQNYPGTFLEVIYKIFPGYSFFIVMVLGQALGPFYLVYLFWWLLHRKKRGAAAPAEESGEACDPFQDMATVNPANTQSKD